MITCVDPSHLEGSIVIPLLLRYAHAQGVKRLGVCISVVVGGSGTKVARSRDLGTEQLISTTNLSKSAKSGFIIPGAYELISS